MAGAQYIGAAPHVRDLFIDQRQKEVVAGRRGRSCLPSPKAIGKRVGAACQCAGVRLADCATQGIAATVAIVFIAIFISLYFFTSQANN